MRFNSRFFILTLSIVCIFAALSPMALAHEHYDTEYKVSSWAEAEIQRASEVGLIPVSGLPNDYQAPITRAQFRYIAMNYIAVQENCGAEIFGKLVEEFIAEKDPDGSVKSVFSDGDKDDSLAYYLGLVKGRGNGTFDPDSLISRQEAAVMLMQSYQVYSDDVPADTTNFHYVDGGEIADWAAESVATLSAWGVLNGVKNGAFMPNEEYSIEQCILTFLRLYENGPVTRIKSNVKPLFSYEQCMGYLRAITVSAEDYQAGDMVITSEIAGPVASFLRLDVTGVMMGRSYLYFLYHDGGIRPVDIGICSYPTPENQIFNSLQTENYNFPEDGQTFFCDALLLIDVFDARIGYEDVLVHQSGTYHVEINIATNQYRLDREDLPETLNIDR